MLYTMWVCLPLAECAPQHQKVTLATLVWWWTFFKDCTLNRVKEETDAVAAWIEDVLYKIRSMVDTSVLLAGLTVSIPRGNTASGRTTSSRSLGASHLQWVPNTECIPIMSENENNNERNILKLTCCYAISLPVVNASVLSFRFHVFITILMNYFPCLKHLNRTICLQYN